MERTAKAQWKGGLKDGNGTISAPSGVLNNSPYTFLTRFENAKGTNPEELLAAAHASCFTMAVSAGLTGAGTPPDELNTEATAVLEFVDGKPTITKVRLKIHGKVPGIDAAKFQAVAADAKANCPISRVLNAEISLEATFG